MRENKDKEDDLEDSVARCCCRSGICKLWAVNMKNNRTVGGARGEEEGLLQAMWNLFSGLWDS
jgi:hypothetical protein